MGRYNESFVSQAESILNRISETSYDGQLRKSLVIHSVNCKEWEAEKKLFSQKIVDLDSESLNRAHLAATRWYVDISSSNHDSYSRHRHIGHIDFRPISPTVSDAFLPIPEKENFFVTCQKMYKSDDFSDPVIRTVPYIIPDQRLSWCAPASMWIIFTSLSNELGRQYLSLYEIIDNLPKKNGSRPIEARDFDRLIEKLGYSYYYYYGNCKQDLYDDIERKFESGECKQECKLKHLYDHIWREKKNYNLMDSSVLYPYIESEIPVYLVFKYADLLNIPGYPATEHDSGNPPDDCHAVVAIGHTLDDNGEIDTFIVHDVSASPFITIPRDFIDTCLLEAVVILPENTYHYNFVRLLLTKTVETIALFDDKIRGIIADGKIIYRAYLMRSQRVKFWFTDRTKYPEQITNTFSRADVPQYVWVFEMSNPELKISDLSIG